MVGYITEFLPRFLLALSEIKINYVVYGGLF